MLKMTLDALLSRVRTGRVSAALPSGLLPEPFRGKPAFEPEKLSREALEECARACPTGAMDAARKTLDLGRCLFCGLCEEACGGQGLRFTPDPCLPCGRRDNLILGGEPAGPAVAAGKLRRLVGRSLHLREVSAGGCNGCDMETQAVGNPIFDLQSYGIDFVASPRHADGLLVTGPVTTNMKEALLKTYEAVPAPRLVIAVGACAISGGLFRGSYATHGGVASTVPVDLYIPGCPPHPLTLLYGILGYFDRYPRK
jgi:Ni,Fe-hydrogenase III small subunit